MARCTVERLMKQLGIEGIRLFTAPVPNEVWVADFTYVSTYQGFAYMAFVIDLFARRIVGWKVQAI